MKRMQKLMLVIVVVMTGTSMLLTSCQKDDLSTTDEIKNTEYIGSASETNTVDCNLTNPSETITADEVEMIKYMREEEKLAKDVYITLFAQWQEPVFENISKSEQVHMDKILCLLDYYNIPDPASEDIGVFENADLQGLYNTLIAQGSTSLIDALIVGATIEDVDIFDLENDINLTSNEAIINIFESLMCGSRNHMRAFTTQLDIYNETYSPQYISQEEFDEIYNAEHEFCGNGGGGNGNGGGGNGNGGGGNHNGGGNGSCDGSGGNG